MINVVKSPASRLFTWVRAALLLVISFGIFAVSQPASAQSTAEGKIVRDIDVRYLGDRTIDAGRVLGNMQTSVGDALSSLVLDEDIKSLYQSGDVDDVRIVTENLTDGVKLIVLVRARALLSQVAFAGNSGISSKKLRAVVQLDVGNSFDDAELQIARQDIEEYYAKKGYAEATVNYRIEDTPEGFSRAVFQIDEGTKAVLKDIFFEGNTVFSDRDLKKQLQVKEKSLFNFFRGGKIDPDVLAEDVTRLRDFYGDSGYIDSDVNVRTDPTPKGDKVNLVFEITEGQPYSVESVSLTGLTVFDASELRPALLTESGQPYSVSSIREDESTLRDYYGAKGYADVRISTRIDRAPGKQLKVRYAVSEGAKSYIRKINIAGNDKTQDKVIRRELAVAPGDEYNLVKVDASKRRLESLQYFAPGSGVDIFPTDTLQEGYKDLNVRVEETSTGSVNFGAGFSSIDNLVGFIEVTQSNFDLFGWGNGFTGGGQRFGLNLRAGSERRDFSLSLYEPWFNDYKIGVGGELFYRDLLFLSDRYDERKVGGRLYARKATGANSYIQPEITIQNVTVSVDGSDDDLDDDISDVLRQEDGDYFQAKLGLTWVMDKRDSQLITRSGYRISAGANASVAGDVDHIGFELSGSKYFSLPFDTIFSVRGSAEFVSGDAPIFDRLFLGGANDLRGFEFRDVGPKDEFGEPLGGKSAIFASAEYTFPIVERVRGAAFYDIGAVSSDSFDVGDVNSNFGFGLRLYLPVGPIRLDFGIPVQSDEFNDSNGQFNFNIGYSF